MIGSKFLKKLAGWCKSVWPYYLTAYMLVFSLIGIGLAHHTGANIYRQVLNRLRPADFKPFMTKTQTPEQTDEAFRFFVRAKDVMRQDADAWGIYGYFSYLKGNRKEAIRAYETALELNPTFYWFHYNLAVLHYQAGEYEKAASYILETRKLNLFFTFLFIRESRHMYLPFIVSVTDNPQPALMSQYKEKSQIADRYLELYQSVSLFQEPPEALKNFKPDWDLELY